MGFLDFLLYAVLVIYLLYITRVQGLWGKGKTASRAKNDIRSEKSIQRRRNRRIKLLRFLDKFSTAWGKEASLYEKDELNYKISRIGKKDKLLNRNYSATEVIGTFKLLSVVSLFLATFFFVLTFNPLALIFLVGIFGLRFYHTLASARIESEDEELEEDFPDLYLILYSRLIQGVRARLAPALKDYLVALDAMSGREDKEAIRKFVIDLRGYIDLYGSDDVAISKVREKYRSVMIINFANLAVQAMRGVQNEDKLFSFKMELNQKRLISMDKRADKMMWRGSFAVKAMYLILGQFVFLTFWAKLSLSLGGIRNIFGF